MKTLALCTIAIALIGTPAVAADMAVKAPPPAPAPVYSWTGFTSASMPVGAGVEITLILPVMVQAAQATT
jgi:hypothetical protein